MTSHPSISVEALRQHLKYNAWATARVLDAAAKLTPDELNHDFHIATGNVVRTLAHIFAADRTWIGRLKQSPPAQFASDADHDFATLPEKWAAVAAAWEEWAAALTDETAQGVLIYRDLKGNLWSQPVWQIVLHVVNHGTHHRGEVIGFIRALGHTPPPLDLIVYYRQAHK